MPERLDHDRFDQVLSWAPFLGVDSDKVVNELSGLRSLSMPDRDRERRRRAEHLQRHIDAGEVICDCYEEARTDRLGRDV